MATMVLSQRPYQGVTVRHSPLRSTAAVAAAVIAATGIGTGVAFATGSTTTAPAPTTAPHRSAHSATVKLPAHATLQQIQAASATDISNRVTSLTAAVAKVQKAGGLASDQAALVRSLQAAASGLQRLGHKIAGDTTAPAAKTDYGQIFAGYRVYRLALPVTRLVVVADRITVTTGPRLTKVAARISSMETPANQAQVQPLLADLANQVSSATSATKGLPTTLEGYTPAQFNGDRHLLEQARSTTKTALGDLVKARSDAKAAAADEGLGRGRIHHGPARVMPSLPGPSTPGQSTPGPSTFGPAPAPAASA
ncbi:MAG: hypothetical protein M3137_02720 [Actinomycetota bacterium]|nr:hypothetical protein [Actinomycetota bacterium]